MTHHAESFALVHGLILARGPESRTGPGDTLAAVLSLGRRPDFLAARRVVVVDRTKADSERPGKITLVERRRFDADGN